MKTKILHVVTLCFMLSIGVGQVSGGFTKQEMSNVVNLYRQYKLQHDTAVFSFKGYKTSTLLENYCSQVVHLYYRSQLDEMLQQAQTENNTFLKTALEAAIKGIDTIGKPFYVAFHKETNEIANITHRSKKIGAKPNIQQQIKKLQALIQSHKTQKTLKIVLNAKYQLCSVKEPILNIFCRINAPESHSLLLNLKDESGQLLVDVNAQDDTYGYTALHNACCSKNLELVKKLLALKDTSDQLLVDVNKQTTRDETALETACSTPETCNLDIIQLLLDHGANPNPAIDCLQTSYSVQKYRYSDQEINRVLQMLAAYHISITPSVYNTIECDASQLFYGCWLVSDKDNKVSVYTHEDAKQNYLSKYFFRYLPVNEPETSATSSGAPCATICPPK